MGSTPTRTSSRACGLIRCKTKNLMRKASACFEKESRNNSSKEWLNLIDKTHWGNINIWNWSPYEMIIWHKNFTIHIHTRCSFFSAIIYAILPMYAFPASNHSTIERSFLHQTFFKNLSYKNNHSFANHETHLGQFFISWTIFISGSELKHLS